MRNLFSGKLRIPIAFLTLFIDIYGAVSLKSICTGTIIDKDGTILTCAHAVVNFQGLRASPEGKVSGCIIYGFMSFFRIIEKY